ncbi:MAG TPA: hypothetical protein VGP07_07290 [Polyangia bacterium]|jgi:hypothetical protein
MIPQQPAAENRGRLEAAEPRIAILVLGCLLTVYQRCIDIIRATWASRSVANVDIFYVYGGQYAKADQPMVDVEHLICRARPALRDGEVWESGDILLCGSTDIREGQPDCILRKRLHAFRHLAKLRAYDFVYTVCACSYVDVERLKRYVSALPPTGVYHGVLHVHGESGYPFLSGASFLLSRDLAADLGENDEKIISDYPDVMPDDVVIGHFIATRHCPEPLAEISRRIVAATRPTDNQTFVMPYGHGSMDFVTAPSYSQVPNEPSYHFHFNSRRMWDMENFHRRFFAPHESRATGSRRP